MQQTQPQVQVQPPPQKAVANLDWARYTTVGVVGQKGAGKTRFTLGMSSQFGKPVVFIDPVGAARGHAVLSGSYVKVGGFVGVEKLVSLFRSRATFIFDISNMRQYDRSVFMDNVCTALRQVHDYVLVVDEAGDFIPQEKSRRYSWETEEMVRTGRNHGIRPQFLITQRTQKVDKNAFALCDVFIFFRIVYHLDLDKVRDILDMDDEEFSYLRNVIMTLPDGEAVVFMPDKYGGRNVRDALVRVRFL
jgi:hypothetical protein